MKELFCKAYFTKFTYVVFNNRDLMCCKKDIMVKFNFLGTDIVMLSPNSNSWTITPISKVKILPWNIDLNAICFYMVGWRTIAFWKCLKWIRATQNLRNQKLDQIFICKFLFSCHFTYFKSLSHIQSLSWRIMLNQGFILLVWTLLINHCQLFHFFLN